MHATSSKRRLQVFSRSDVDANPIHWQPLFCPAYVLEECSRPTCSEQVEGEKHRMTFREDRRFMHGSVALVRNLKTGRVSPQFHQSWIRPTNTVNGRDGNDPPPSYWQARCGFTKGKRVLLLRRRIPVEFNRKLWGPVTRGVYRRRCDCARLLRHRSIWIDLELIELARYSVEYCSSKSCKLCMQ
jgi:hypothetical protein